MDEKENETDDSVNIIVEISGEYGRVIDKLEGPSTGQHQLEELSSDLHRLLTTLQGMDGGTRSAIADRLPEDMNGIQDGHDVVDALQLLEKFEHVHLDGNTWKPGPEPE